MAQLPQAVPDGVGIDEHLNEIVPLNIPFKDDNGKEIFLGKYFNQGKPVILTLNYSDCPMLCSLQLSGLVSALKEIDEWTSGKQFQVVSVSIDPAETTLKAKDTKAKYLNAYGKQNAASGWSFLTGTQDSIKKLTDAVGFQYRFVPETGEYAHTAALIICAPDGKITRYLYGVEYPPQTLKLSLLEASAGKVGTSTDKILLFCYRYDPHTGAYSLLATRVMTFGALCTLGLVCLLVVPVWYRSMRSKTKASGKSNPSGNISSDQSISPAS
ncbi:MAG: SCO family protein [Planctomycetaceae bacterium]|nr:SCO family protein [Planctomycetaceae bacterium]